MLYNYNNYDNFPKLRNGELCRCLPNSRHLEPLSSAACSSPQLLKERVGNSCTYICTLQRGLDLAEVFGLLCIPNAYYIIVNASMHLDGFIRLRRCA